MKIIGIERAIINKKVNVKVIMGDGSGKYKKETIKTDNIKIKKSEIEKLLKIKE